jgi:hypothetical protein
MVLWRKSPIGLSSCIENLYWDRDFTLCGTYTFGNPRVGDKDWKDAIDKFFVDIKGKYQFYRVINANDIVCSVPPALPLGFFKRHPQTDLSQTDSAPHLEPLPKPVRVGIPGLVDHLHNLGDLGHHRLVNFLRGLDRIGRPGPGLTLNDFHHLGTPVRLPYRYGKMVEDERGMLSVIYNLAVEVGSTPLQLFEGSFLSKVLVLLNFFTCGMVGLLRDHIPSEYLKNLNAMRQTQ